MCLATVPEERKQVRSRVEIIYSDTLDATICREEQTTRVADISLEWLLKAVAMG